MPDRLTCALGPLALAALLPLTATADPPPSCPADAEQRLYDMETGIRQGTQTNVAPVVELAEWAIETCPDRPDAQAIASTLMSAAMGATSDLDTLEHYITLALTAVSQNDYAWNTKQKPSVLKQADGSEQNYFGYNAATTTLLQYAVPYLIRLGNSGRVHPAISGTPYEACPFADHSSSRLQEEANLWDRTVTGQTSHPGFGWAENRLNALYAVCPSHKLELDFYLARLYGQEIETLTRWDHNYNEFGLYGLSEWYWDNPIKGAFNTSSDMEKAKAELDAIARPLAEKARPHIDTMMHTPDDQVRVYSGEKDKVSLWDKAVKRLDPPTE